MADVAEWPKWLNNVLTRLEQSSIDTGPSAAYGRATIAPTLRKELRDICVELHQLHLERKALKEALERGRETLHKAIAERADMQAMVANRSIPLRSLKDWCERNGHDYALGLVLAALGESGKT